MRTLATLLLTATALCTFHVHEVGAAMRSLGDGELSAVTGRAGVSIDLDLAVHVTADSFRISDSSATPNWLEFKGVSVDNGSGGSFSLLTHDSNFNITPVTLDVSTDSSGRTILSVVDTSRTNPRFYTVNDIFFAGQALGGLRIGPVQEGPGTLRIASAAPGYGSGIAFEYGTRVDVGTFRYAYNTGAAFSLNGVHLFGTAAGAPELAPADWGMTGNFRIGDLTSSTPNPATLRAETDASGVSSTVLNLPLQGSIRVEDLSFGSTSFGPMAIDGINVHRLQVRFTP